MNIAINTGNAYMVGRLYGRKNTSQLTNVNWRMCIIIILQVAAQLLPRIKVVDYAEYIDWYQRLLEAYGWAQCVRNTCM